ncbi:uncharacterized protein PGTG_08369 [Puccinia graminis f. sp. tritici CRL 75-36-700-3]|uniref:Uncharacterized protein n=1 Tax=Puccinia graminis f. sp. tritici (strain CRL 75-36-700-3 / race SCCL) TaxID=418459 RepID=E3KDH7_PUCGT|nr:uncharacterized protein PGTG_08369 [Puccinia graminis f. sp. tritici CRL 75-36-700-3]EFP82413.1 hypothetical protein PGTG_08369 [Puccinia graminis f. sp. tritici CRL 75-36-700-3]
MNPAQQAIQIAAINQLLEGSGAVVDFQLPTEAQKTRGRPKGATNKPRTTKWELLEFKHVKKKRKKDESEAVKAKKQKLNNAKAAMKEFRKADQKALQKEEDEALEEEEQIEASEARKNSPQPSKRILPPRRAWVKAPPPAKIDLPPAKPNEAAPSTTEKEDSPPTKAGPAPKKKIRPIKTASLPAKDQPPSNEQPAVLPPKPFDENEPDEADSSFYRQYLPNIIKDSVKSILNPRSDGHCG